VAESEQTTRLRIVRDTNAAELNKEQLRALVQLAGDAKDVVIEIIRTALSNPLMGAVVGVILVNVLERAGVIDHGTGLLADSLIGGSFGVTMAADVIQAIGDLKSVFGGAGQAAPPDLVKPSAQVIVFAPGSSAGSQEEIIRSLPGLLEKLALPASKVSS
jgi:hypothetical protein